MNKTVLVLGANGRFGRAAVNAFAAAGWRVFAQVRRAPSTPFPMDVATLAMPLADTAGLAASRASVVVHAVNPLYTRWDEEAMPMLRCGLDLAERLRAHFMLPGNVYNHGEGMPPLLDERTPERPTTPKGRQRVAMEAEIAARAGLRSTVIRAGDFFGGGTGSWLDLMIAKDIARGRLVYPGPPDLLHAWAYLPDLARAFVAVAARGEGPRVQRLHFGGHALTGREFIAALQAAAAGLGLEPASGWKVGGFPWPLIRAAGLVWPMGRELARMSYLWRVPHALDGRALEAAVGPLPATPIAEALAQSLRDLGLGGRQAGHERALSSAA